MIIGMNFDFGQIAIVMLAVKTMCSAMESTKLAILKTKIELILEADLIVFIITGIAEA